MHAAIDPPDLPLVSPLAGNDFLYTRGGKREQMEKNAATNSHLSESHLVPPVTRQIQIQLQIQK